MKRIIALVAALVIGGSLFLAPPASAGPKKNRLFYSMVTEQAPSLRIGRAFLVRNAKANCRNMRRGVSPTRLAWILVEHGLTVNAAVAFVGGSITFYCPGQEKYI